MAATTHKHKKKKNFTPESKFRLDLDICSKNKDLSGAISLYESAVSNQIHLSNHHFNSLLYICSNAVTDPSLKPEAIRFGFRVFDRMVTNKIDPNEATITAVARLAAAKGDGDLAFELVKSVGNYPGVSPKLRSYGPALFCFCGNLEADKAYAVEEHMGSVGIHPEEPELTALLKVSVDNVKEEKVYEYLHKLRGAVRYVSEPTAEIVESWFVGELASELGLEEWDVDKLKESISRNGGGWHGQGWLGKGKWVVQRSSVESGGHCCSCGELLACVDIDRQETEKFAQSVASLALEREVQANFKEFQDWLDEHSEYEAIVDGANIGLYQQNFAEGGFSIPQLNAVVKELYNSSKKWPLVILHKKRVQTILENPSNREMIQEWMDRGILYGTPFGSNDDWYWLYATVKLKCLLVTNDEMRDHIFELLGSSFFLRWKERHQVRYTFVKGKLKLQMPPLYSFVIQESERGAWHVPIAGENTEESSRTWLCIRRAYSSNPSDNVPVTSAVSEIGQSLANDHFSNSGTSESVRTDNVQDGNSNSCLICDDKPMTVTGKRKDRCSSHS